MTRPTENTQLQTVRRAPSQARAGFGVARLGFTLILTALLAFIGLPLFIFGLALMQAQER